MKALRYILFLFVFCPVTALSQYNVVVRVLDKEEAEPLADVLVTIDTLPGIQQTDSTGWVSFNQVTAGSHTLVFSRLGYFRKKVKATITGTDILTVYLETQEEELEEVVIVSTRVEMHPNDMPRRVDVVNEEEVEERSHDKPSDMSHIVREQTGVQVQRTSATAGTMSIRLQGLRGRYTQVLRDGFALFGGFANAIEVTQIPPLDLKQVEIVKGPSSTLYGPDAIAGVVNLIPKAPGETPVYDVMLNGESALAADVGLYAAQRIKWFAFTVTGMYRYQKEKDWNADNFTETPFMQRYYIAPQLFFDITPKAKLNVGVSYTNEDRLGGAVPYLKGIADTTYSYYEQNLSQHLATNFSLSYSFDEKGKLTLKNAFNYFERSLQLPYYLFTGVQMGTVTELNYHVRRKRHDVVLGVDLRTDQFTEGNDSSAVKRNYSYLTPGFFIQYMYKATERTTLEGGLRVDYNNRYKVYPLPHFGLRQKWTESFLSRLNFGMGYKLPTIFQDESEAQRFIKVLGIADSIRPELSIGGTADLVVKLPNYNGLNVTLNQMYFITHIFRPLIAKTQKVENCTTNDCTELYYVSARGFQQSKGIETSLHISYRGFNASVAYTLTDNNLRINNVKSIAPLTSKHIVSMLVGYETKLFGAGIDCYYYSPVKLSDGTVGRRMWEFGINGQLALRHILIFMNLENVFGIKQSNYGPIVEPGPTYAHPQFAEIYGPLEGILFNLGVKLHLAAFNKKWKAEGGIEKLRKADND